MVWQEGLSLPASLSFTAAHICAAPHTTGRQMYPCLARLYPPRAQKKFMVLCTSLSSSCSPGRCLPYFQLWDFSADSPEVLSCLAKPCHLYQTESGISPSLLRAERADPSPQSTQAVTQPSETGVSLQRICALVLRRWLFQGSHSAGAEPQLQGFTPSTALPCLLLS